MSGNPSTQTLLNSRKDHFEFDVEIEDPGTGLVSTFTMEVDTGSPFAILLPNYCSQFFNNYQGDVNVGGAGSGQSPLFEANLKSVGQLNMNFQTYAVMGLDKSYDYGLLGINFLKYVKTEIYGPESNKEIMLEDTHLP